MIKINITLIFQIAHFLFAWWFLRRFLWRQVVAVLERQQRRKEKLEEQLERQQQLVAQKQAEIDALWRDAQQAFLVNTPQFRQPVCLKSATIGPERRVVAPDQAVVASMARQLAEKVRDYGPF